MLPFWLSPASRPRFQKLWGTPGNFRKVKYRYDGPSGPRTLMLRLSKQIDYTTEDGFDGAIDDAYHAVVSAIAVNPPAVGKPAAPAWVWRSSAQSPALMAATWCCTTVQGAV